MQVNYSKTPGFHDYRRAKQAKPKPPNAMISNNLRKVSNASNFQQIQNRNNYKKKKKNSLIRISNAAITNRIQCHTKEYYTEHLLKFKHTSNSSAGRVEIIRRNPRDPVPERLLDLRIVHIRQFIHTAQIHHDGLVQRYRRQSLERVLQNLDRIR